jgi:dihydrofolate synthase/folylpolyglutamate synthase
MSGRESQSIRTLEEAAGYLEGLINVEKRPDFSYERLSLAPARALLERVGSPERELSVLHIAGSKGKGSTALLAESVLRAAGRRVGTFTSPHFEHWTERFRIDGRDVAGAALAAAIDRLRPHVDALRNGPHPPSFFDATTAAALLLFRDADVDHAVLEVGLGGRLDSTNVARPAVTCVTSIELEHTDKLGETLAEIAAEKAGIAKPGVPLVMGALADPARSVVEAVAEQVGAPVSRLGRDFRVTVEEEGLGGSTLRIEDGPLDVRATLPVLGAHQPANAALAVACARRLLGGAIDDAALAEASARGLAAATLPGRVEVLRRDPWVIVDSAHTAASARALAGVLERIGAPAHLVLSISSGKDSDAILEALVPRACDVTLTRAEPTRSLEPTEIAALVRAQSPGLALHVVPNPHRALRAAREGLAAGDVLCVAGSVYLAGIARSVLREPRSAARVAVERGSRSPNERG